MPLITNFGLRGRFHLDARWHVVHHRVGKTQRQVELVALRLGAVADADQGQLSSRNPW
jgi:hypothetical protein